MYAGDTQNIRESSSNNDHQVDPTSETVCASITKHHQHGNVLTNSVVSCCPGTQSVDPDPGDADRLPHRHVPHAGQRPSTSRAA